MKSKVNLNWDLVSKGRNSAQKIAKETQDFIDRHTTVSVERTICRLLGIDGVDEMEVPIPNIVVDHLKENNVLGIGVCKYIGNAMIQTKLSPQEIGEKISKKELDITKLEMADDFEIKMTVDKLAKEMVEKIKVNRQKRENYLSEFGDKQGPYLYVIVAT